MSEEMSKDKCLCQHCPNYDQCMESVKKLRETGILEELQKELPELLKSIDFIDCLFMLGGLALRRELKRRGVT